MTISKDKLLRIVGLTQKGKNRVRENGNEVKVLDIWEKVQFSSEPGPWILVQSTKTDWTVWIHIPNDKDFELKELV